MQESAFTLFILFLVAAAVSFVIYPVILKAAGICNLVDKPDIRKQQQHPIPTGGGLVVSTGITATLLFFLVTTDHTDIFPAFCAMMVMLYLGVMDDVLDIKARTKFLVEIIVCTLLVFSTHYQIMNFQGLFGIYELPLQAAVPFSVIGIVGIINAINMIDGVDGLASGMSIFISGCLAVILFLAHEYSYCALTVICAGALSVFFFYNIYGKSRKMYLGDGGTLMLGMAISSIILDITKGQGLTYDDFVPDISRFSLLSFCLAAVSIPVFDTLRVMTVRIINGISPFAPDRRHLHHLLSDNIGMKPVNTFLTETLLDAAVVAVWFISYLLGAGVNLQFGIVAASGLAATVGVSISINRHLNVNIKMEKDR